MIHFRRSLIAMVTMLLVLSVSSAQHGGRPTPLKTSRPVSAKPKLIVMIVVDQMRADYVDKFHGQWNGGLKRLVEQGAWFREAAYPYAATETCVGLATISTGSYPSDHGIVGNGWWDRDTQKMVTCTSDPNLRNTAYAGGTAKGGDSAWRMQMPSFAEELKFQTGAATRILTFSLKARAAITLAGHKADAATWFDSSTGSWVSSPAYGLMPFVDEFARKHPIADDLGKTWSLSLPQSAYLYDDKAVGAADVDGWTAGFPHVLRGKNGDTAPDETFYAQWSMSPFADVYLTKLAIAAVDWLEPGKSGATDYLGVSYSTLDYAGHTFGPRSHEIQDILIRLDHDLGELFAELDKKVGKGNYVVALTGDHGVAPIPVDMQSTGVNTGVVSLPEVQERIEKAMEPFNYGKPVVARMAGNDIYFAPGIYSQLQQNPAAMQAVRDAVLSVTGVAALFRVEEVAKENVTLSKMRSAFALSYFAGRSGDLFVLQKPYWLLTSMTEGTGRHTGTGHGSPYNYDQHVPIFFMGFGIQPGEYFAPVTPADIAPTFAAMTGVTLATRDGHVLAEALKKREQAN
ncbi:MAG TPA: alkaline phosphatase family protein [Candidatus Acidoferrum sp.]|nr:alkaline phosphatase family protein [Candidatus Acidoferrum sp.]